jgi:hypothetical protein
MFRQFILLFIIILLLSYIGEVRSIVERGRLGVAFIINNGALHIRATQEQSSDLTGQNSYVPFALANYHERHPLSMAGIRRQLIPWMEIERTTPPRHGLRMLSAPPSLRIYDSIQFSLPLWYMIALVLCFRWYKRRRMLQRWTAGCCPECGYDVRASTGRCPECGNALPDRRVSGSQES